MITEDYVSFEVTKLLKEKGFNEECLGTYSTSDKELNISSECPYSNDLNDDMFIAAPTLQMTMKWLREVHNLHIEISPFKSYPLDKMTYFYKIYHTDQWNDVLGDFNQCGNFNFPTYEEAAENAIKYCLNNLI